jgi:hypothetical protein
MVAAALLDLATPVALPVALADEAADRARGVAGKR